MSDWGVRWWVLVLAVAAFGCPRETARTTAAPAARVQRDPWTLWASGETRLRGANLYQRRVYPELDHDALGPGPIGPPYERADLVALRELGANWVMVSCPGPFAERAPFAVDHPIVAALDALLARVREAGLHAVLAFRTGPGRSEFSFFASSAGTWFDASYVDESLWTDRAAQDAWVEMTRWASRRWGARLVAIEPLVEPNANARVARARAPEAFAAAHGGSLADWNQLAPRLVAAVRAADPHLPVIVSPMGHGSPEWLEGLRPIDAPRVIYAVHDYAPWHYTHQAEDAPIAYPDEVDVDGDGRPDLFTPEWVRARVAGVVAWRDRHAPGAPLAVTEFGVRRWAPDAAAFLADQIAAFESAGMSHALWMWHPDGSALSRQDAFDILRSGDPRDHEDLPTSALLATIRHAWSRNRDRSR